MRFGSVQSSQIRTALPRQTVISGNIDANGLPNALTVGSGLSPTLVTTINLSFAAGWDATGTIDYFVQLTGTQTFASITANSTAYLYFDRSATGTITTGFSLILPVYQLIAPTSPSTDQHWFDLATFTMKRWNGSAWIVFQRIFIGEAITGTSTVSSVVTYAYRGFYQSTWLAVSANSNYSFNHNLGINLSAANANISLFASSTSSDNDALIATPAFYSGTAYYGYQARANSNTRKTYTLATTSYVGFDGSNVWQTSSYYKLTVSRSW